MPPELNKQRLRWDADPSIPLGRKQEPCRVWTTGSVGLSLPPFCICILPTVHLHLHLLRPYVQQDSNRGDTLGALLL